MARPGFTLERSDRTVRMVRVTASLVAFTEEARAALGGKASVAMTHFPFRVGRESRVQGPLRALVTDVERRLGSVPQLNDLYLIEPPSSEAFHISREHFTIERHDTGFVLVDRRSACGTIVGGKTVKDDGGTIRSVGDDRRGGQSDLQDGNLIIVGGRLSPYAFRFVVHAD